MNSRELAISIWIGIGLILAWLLLKKDKESDNIISEFAKILVEIIHQPIFIVWVLYNLIFLSLFIAFALRFCLSMWFLLGYFIILLFGVLPAIEYLNRKKLAKTIKDSLKKLLFLPAIPLFIHSSYTFNFWIEFVTVPILLFFGLLLGVTETKEGAEEYVYLNKFINGLLILYGIVVLILSIRLFIQNISDAVTLEFWFSFSLDILVWIINLPILILIHSMLKVEILANLNNGIGRRLLFYLKYYSRQRRLRKRYSEHIGIQKITKVIANPYYLGNRCTVHVKDDSTLKEIENIIVGLRVNKYIYDESEKNLCSIQIRNSENKIIAFWGDEFIPEKHHMFRNHEEFRKLGDMFVEEVFLDRIKH
ncbi:MAG: hypothetical protein FWG67_00170 [Defluviitaleaceae bacterium]|nr:hypothetical protein [Defluviitaleaceae bacterium]